MFRVGWVLEQLARCLVVGVCEPNQLAVSTITIDVRRIERNVSPWHVLTLLRLPCGRPRLERTFCDYGERIICLRWRPAHLRWAVGVKRDDDSGALGLHIVGSPNLELVLLVVAPEIVTDLA